MNIETYNKAVREETDRVYATAQSAKKKGVDPKNNVEIPLVENLAERVEGLISIVAPQIIGSGISERISELENQYSPLDWRIGLIIALEIAQQKFCTFKEQKEAIEVGIRAGLAYLTMGTVSSPLEGFVELNINDRLDNKGKFFTMKFSGPIRSAGGTGASVSLLIGDYVRKKLGFAEYDPTPEEAERFAVELYDYHERVTNLQYLPSEEEIVFLGKHIPIQVSGGPSETIEVSRFKGLSRVSTDCIRNGVCLVLGEGVAQKAPKLWKQLSKWGDEFGLGHWKFLEEFLKIQKKIKAKGGTQIGGGAQKISPDYTFIKDLVAGRPVLTYPLRYGGFRLRYGRARTSGYSCTAVHPATMYIMNQYLAIGTQLKLERPGKGATITSCSTIDGPIIRTKEGDVIQLETLHEAKKYSSSVVEVIFLGDLLVNYGDFFNRAHVLVPPGYCPEWWIKEVEKACKEKYGSLDFPKLSAETAIDEKDLLTLFSNPLHTKISGMEACAFSETLQVPLHPAYTYFWSGISLEETKTLLRWMLKANVLEEGKKITLPDTKKHGDAKRALEKIGLPHLHTSNEFVVIEKEHAHILQTALSIDKLTAEEIEKLEGKDGLEVIRQLSPFTIRDKAGTFIGARMGRPEKGKIRKLKGSPHVLFPVGDEGGRMRSLQSALDKGKVTAEFPSKHCPKCDKDTIYVQCERCGMETVTQHYCRMCQTVMGEECSEHGPTQTYQRQSIDIRHYFKTALARTDMNLYPEIIKGVRGTSNKGHVPEHLIKGILRAKYNLFTNKDGTIRYDMSQLPLTHFKPKEAGTTVAKLQALGYEKDIKGAPLERDDQIVELLPQDVILPLGTNSPEKGADKILFNIAAYVDDLLVHHYGQEPYYNLKSTEELIGQLIVALAPHTSAAIVCRIIGFSHTQVFFAHPALHAATRRDCDGDEAGIMLLMDMLLNFSRHYLPNHRGATQDAPLVLTSTLIPSEVDDMVFDMDVSFTYPLELYEAANDYKDPGDVDVALLGGHLKKKGDLLGLGFTHDTDNLNEGVLCSAYKTIPTMEDKLKGQMDLAEKLLAVDASDVAAKVINKHFLKDLKGNLRKYMQQNFRCVDCNKKYSRPPLVGVCLKCKGKLVFSVARGSVIKYLEPSLSLARKYKVPPYLMQDLELTKLRVEGVFGRDKEKQTGLGSWF